MFFKLGNSTSKLLVNRSTELVYSRILEGRVSWLNFANVLMSFFILNPSVYSMDEVIVNFTARVRIPAARREGTICMRS